MERSARVAGAILQRLVLRTQPPPPRLRVEATWRGGSRLNADAVSTETADTVSVVVAAYDEERHIGRLLRSLRSQSRVPDEVIVVDDGSGDGTVAVAEREGARVLRLPHGGPALARNAGAAAANGAVLVFLDGDMACEPDFVERLVAPILGGAIGSFTKEMYLGNPGNRWARAYASLRWSPPDRLLPHDLPDEWDNFRALRRAAFLAAGGYDDVGYGEDRTLAPKLGELAVSAPGAVCLHFQPESVREIFENGRWVGRGAAIRTLERPWHIHALPRVVRIALEQIRAGRTGWVLPARVVYHSGVWLGLAQSSLRPDHHWK